MKGITANWNISKRGCETTLCAIIAADISRRTSSILRFLDSRPIKEDQDDYFFVCWNAQTNEKT